MLRNYFKIGWRNLATNKICSFINIGGLAVGMAVAILIGLWVYFMNNWIQQYTYHTNISWWIFMAAGFGALLITLLTVSFHAIKAAIENPVKSLRTE